MKTEKRGGGAGAVTHHGDERSLAADVLIIGLGPVGKMLAIQLGRQGHSVIAIDRNADSYPLPRAVTHCADVARILQSIGLAPDTIAHITEPFDGIYRWRNGAGEALLEVDWSGLGESGWHNTYFFHQPDLEDALDDILAGLPSVTLIRRWAAISLAQGRDAVQVVVETASGEQVVIGAEWVIGADGANSTVRRLSGIEWRDEGYSSDWLVVDIKLRDGGPGFPRIASQHCDPARPSTMVPAGPGRRRWEFMRLTGETLGQLNTVAKVWELLAPHGLTPMTAELERHAVYTFEAGWAAQWRDRRVFLVGDAAHLMPPFAGQGLGAGLRDAQNLSWKLSAVLRGVAAERLLDTYSSERQHHAIAFVKFSTELGRIVCLTDPDRAAARDRRMIGRCRAQGTPPARPPRPGLGPGLHLGPHGGQLARQGRTRVPGTDTVERFDDLFGGAGALVTRTADTIEVLGATARAALHALDIATVALTGIDQCPYLIDDIDGIYGRWLDELNADTILIRPDFHLFGSARARDTGHLVDCFLDAIGVTTLPGGWR